MGRLVPLFIDAPDLEEPQLRDAPGEIFRRDLQKGCLERGPQMGLEFAERIGHFEGCISRREAAFDQRVGDAFVPAVNGQRVAQAQQAGMGAVGVGFGMQAGHDPGRNAVESVEPRDFLDEIDFAVEIVAERGWLPGRFVVMRRGALFAAELGQIFLHDVSGNFDSKQASYFFRAELDGASSRRWLTRDGRRGGNRCAGQFDEEGQRTVARGEQRAGVDAPLVTIGGVGDESQPAARAPHRGGLEPGGFEHDFRGRFGDAGGLAAHDARDGDGAAFVGDDEVVGQQLVGHVVERLDLFARARAADLDDAPGEFSRVEGVERLAGFEEDVVGDVDDVVDRAMAGGGDGLLQPCGARADFDVGEMRRTIIRAKIGRAEPGRPRGRVSRKMERRGGDDPEAARADGGDFPRDAAIGEEVGAVGGDLDVEEGVAGLVLGEDFPEGRVRREDEKALGVLGERQFLLGAQHALGKFAAQFRFLDDETARQLRAGQGERHFVADLVVLRAADDLARGRTVVDLADAEAVGVGVLRGGKNLRDDDVGALHAGDGNVLDLGAGEGEPVEHLRHGNGEVEIMAEPAKREFHGRKRESSMLMPVGDGKIATLLRKGSLIALPCGLNGRGRFLCGELFLGVSSCDRVG